MKGESQPRWEELARRYDLLRQPEWDKLLRHFELSEGFSFVVLLVLDADGAALCRRELEILLKREGKQLLALDLTTPTDLRELPSRLLATDTAAETACLWVAAVEPDYSKTYSEWRDAWRTALARLNAHRNPLREQFRLALTFVGAPWLQEVLREIAPDLWSVRTLVARIEPAPQATTERAVQQATRSDSAEERGGGDPLFALQEAEKLRGVPGKELAVARLAHRAGEGFAGRDQWREAEKAFTEALELKERASATPASLLVTLQGLAWTCQLLGQARRSMSLAERALNIAREIKDRRAEGSALNHLGIAYADLGDARKAIEFYEQALVIAREIGDRREEAVVLGNLGSAHYYLSDARKAIEFYEQCLKLHREIGDRRGEGNALGGLGNVYFSSGNARKAIESYEKQLTIDREIGDRRGEGNALFNSALAFRKLGDRAQAVSRAEAALKVFKAIEDPNAAKVCAALAKWRGK
jgi:tetratricopeptide (TPR) repeat protein